MFFLTAAVLARMARTRVNAVTRKEMALDFYRTYDKGEEPEQIRRITRNFINLFEVPVLFYVGVVLVYISHQVNYWMVGCAWTYVALRFLHTYIHLMSNDVLTRFRVYFASGLVLLVMWSSLLVQLVRAG
ncbi:MAG: hypothetical protein E4H03_00275 [Myxococcales bacterium]|nr:MAG: hypothetical protein E4H03_00275 [Myxococcales bacterium]